MKREALQLVVFKSALWFSGFRLCMSPVLLLGRYLEDSWNQAAAHKQADTFMDAFEIRLHTF